MQLTGREIIARGVLTDVDLENAVQQQGVDIRLDTVQSVGWSEDTGFDKPGYIPVVGKTRLPEYHKVEPLKVGEVECFNLMPGYYEVTFIEGCNIPDDLVLSNIKSRSSLVRCGAHIECGQFDAGFETEHMGCFLVVEVPIVIEKGARIGQVQVYETRKVDQRELYNGQWQNDKQRSLQ